MEGNQIISEVTTWKQYTRKLERRRYEIVRTTVVNLGDSLGNLKAVVNIGDSSSPFFQ